MKTNYKKLFGCIVISLSLCCCKNNSEKQKNNENSFNEVDHFAIQFDSKGGSAVESQWVIKGEKIEKPADPVRNGYSFGEWTYRNEPWSFIGYGVTENMTLEATWNLSTYTITYDFNGGTLCDNPATYTIEDSKILNPSNRTGYTFVGWSDEYGRLLTCIERGTYGNLNLTAIWSVNNYNVTVSTTTPSRGRVSGSGSFDYGSEVTISATPYTGYYFYGWHLNSARVSTNEVYTFVQDNSAKEFVGVFNPIIYQITYILNGGNGYNSGTYNIESSFYLNNPTKTGFSFEKWTDQNGNTVQSIVPGMTGNLELTAHWIPNKYNVVINNNTKNGLVSGDGTYDYGSTVVLEAFPNNGYSFSGWYIGDERVCSTLKYVFILENDNVLIETRWGKITYSITYDLGGGTNNSQNPYSYNVEDTLALFSPTKVGHTFVNWTDESGNVVYSINEGTYGNIKLTANWQVNTYIVNLVNHEEKCGTVSGEGTYEYGSQVTITASPNTGYRLMYWAYEGLSSDAVSTKASYTFTMGDEPVTFTPVWGLVYYGIYYNLNGGTNNPNNPSSYTIESEVIFEAPTRTGYRFVNWTDSLGNIIDSIPVGTSDYISLYANWVLDSFVVNIVNDSTKGTVYGAGAYNYTTTATISATANEGYIFDGWYVDDQLVSKNNPYSFTMPATNKTFEAQWKLTTYTIEYRTRCYSEDGTYNDTVNNWLTTLVSYDDTENNNPATYTLEDAFDLVDPKLHLCTFVNWTDLNGNIVTSVSSGTTGNLVFVANFATNYFEITLVNTDESKGSISGGGLYQLGSKVTISSQPKPGYKIEGWYTSYSTTMQRLESSSPSFDFYWSMVTPRQGATITAVWTYEAYSIDIDCNGGTLNGRPTEYYITSDFDLPIPKRLGYSFLYWKDQNNNIISHLGGSDIYGDISVTAYWEANEYEVSVFSNDLSKGTVAGSGLYAFNSTVNVTAQPINGSVFCGWYSESDFYYRVSTDLNYSFVLKELGINLYAKFGSFEDLETENSKERDAHNGVYPHFNSDYTKVMYGLYPQTYVSNLQLVTELNSLTDENEFGYYEYNDRYYAKLTAVPYYENSIFSDGTLIKKNVTYWFKCEPIEWDILQSSENDYFLFSHLILDMHKYGEYFYGQKQHVDEFDNYSYYYSNNYEYSYLREFLNTEFYNKAFSFNDSVIQVTTVDNSTKPISADSWFYGSENTSDKVFVLSYNELCSTEYGFANANYYPDNYTRLKQCTDFAKAKGTYTLPYYSETYNDVEFSGYWTRTPYISAENVVYVVDCGGYFDRATVENFYDYHYLDGNNIGVCPAINIKIIGS